MATPSTRWIRELAEELGLPHIKLQSLRHSYATDAGTVLQLPASYLDAGHMHGTLHRALEDAVARGYVMRNVSAYANPPKVERQPMKTWSPIQLRTFLEHVAEDRLFAMWVTYATTGLRRGELLGARWDALDLEANRLTIDRIVTVADGRAIVGRPKTTAGRRMISLDADTTAVLVDLRKRQIEERLAAGPAWQDTGLVFGWEDGSPIHPHNPTRWFTELTEELELPHIRLHGLRHTYATVALKAGVISTRPKMSTTGR